MSVKLSDFVSEINLAINKAIGGNLDAADIAAALTAQADALTAVDPPPTHDRTITNTGAELDPRQPG